MGNLWRLKISIGFNEQSTSWPAPLKAEFSLHPFDFYDRPDPAGAVVCTSRGQSQFRRKNGEPKLYIESTGTAPPLCQRIVFEKGQVNINGATASLQAEVDNLLEAAAVIDWIKVTLSQFLSVQLGVYSSMQLIGGTIAGTPFSVIYPGASHCSLVTIGDPDERPASISSAVNLIPIAASSYPRFVTCCSYYQHALRLLSPHEVSFTPYSTSAEVLLNLTKCIEYLYPHIDRNDLSTKLENVGFTKEQIASQLISILVVRNEFDIGHTSNGASSTDEQNTLRSFLIRSVRNVRALLLEVAKRINEKPDFLAPTTMSMDKENRRRLRRIIENLAEPELPCEVQCQNFVQLKIG